MARAVLVGPPLLLLMLAAGCYHRKICWICIISSEVCHAVRRCRTASVLSFVVILLLILLLHRGVAHVVVVVLATRALVVYAFLAFNQGI